MAGPEPTGGGNGSPPGRHFWAVSGGVLMGGKYVVVEYPTKPLGPHVHGPYPSRAAASAEVKRLNGGGGGGNTRAGSTYKVPTRGPVTPREIYALLLQKGLSTTQAVGVMANMWAESKLNVETSVVDSNGYKSVGLINWNEASYTNAGQLVTGNPQKDVRAQIAYLFTGTSGVQAGLKGATAADVAGNWAANVERCVGCQPGSTVANGWTARRGYTTLIQGWVSSGKWPTSGGAANLGNAGKGLSGTAPGSGCLISLPVVGCVLNTSKARALVGGGMILTALPVGLVGAVVLAAFAFRRTGAGTAVGHAAQAAGTAVALIPGAEGIGAGVAAAGSAEARQSQARQKERAQKKQESDQRAQSRHDESEYKKARARSSRASATAAGPPDIPPF